MPNSVTLDTFLITIILLMSRVSAFYSEDDHQNFEEIVVVARQISHMFSNSRLFFLGQSLSWIGKALEIISLNRPAFTTVHYIPFSRDFKPGSPRPGFYTFQSSYLPSKQQQKNYRKLLNDLGLNPHEIFYQYKEFNRKTVIADYVITGSGLASFTYFLLKWSKEQGISLNDALQVLAVSSTLKLAFMNLNNSEFNVPCTSLIEQKRIVTRLSQNCDDPEFVRLVPHYPPRYWTKPLPELDQDLIIETVDKLTKFLEEYDFDTPLVITKSPPTFTLKTPPSDLGPAVTLEIPSAVSHACGPHRRQPKSRRNPFQVILTFNTPGYINRKVYKTLRMECPACTSDEFLVSFIENELKNPSSTVNEILNRACGRKSIVDECQDAEEDSFFCRVTEEVLGL